MTKKTKKVVKAKKDKKYTKRYFGIVKVPSNTKLCWLSKQDKNGWSMGLAFEKRTVWLRGLRFVDPKELAKILKSNVVFVHLKNTKAPVKK